MKFSYALIKQLVPKLKNKKELVEKLNLHSFEAEELAGDVFDVSIAPNRFSDAASHWGIAREIAAILGKNFRMPIRHQISKTAKAPFKVEIKDKNLCPRYAAQYFENVKIGPSPKWMQKILLDCGLRPISNVVDIMNYAMLETGQPLHAFDYDKLATSNKRQATVIVRRAKKSEKIRTIDDKIYELPENILVIADGKRPIAIAGIKGGKDTEVHKKTSRILVEAANFNAQSIYKSSKFLKLQTDASLRFSHDISPELVGLGLNRAAELLKGIAVAKPGPIIDVNYTKPYKKIIRFDSERLKKFIGIDLSPRIARRHLESLGFEIVETKNSKLKTKNSFLVEAPALRQDIDTFEDLAEEVARLYGYNRIEPRAPRLHLVPSGFEDQIVLKDKIRRILAKIGLNEVYNYSFISEKDANQFVFNKELVGLENPISREFVYLRPSLTVGLVRNIENNFRFLDDARVFEIGKIFFRPPHSREIIETATVGIALAAKTKETFFELKGLLREFFKKIGLVDFLLAPPDNKDWVEIFTKDYLESGALLKLESGGEIFGYLGQLNHKFSKWRINICEIDLKILLRLVSEEHEYRPLPKFPSMMRDISVAVPEGVRVGNIMQAIQETEKKFIEDVDLIDEYQGGYTFRIVFQAENRTLIDKEVNQIMEKITKILQWKFKAKIR